MIKKNLVKNSYHPTIGQAYKAKAGRFPCAFGLVPLLLFGLWKKKVVTGDARDTTRGCLIWKIQTPKKANSKSSYTHPENKYNSCWF